jgi:hypothetical protein
MMGEDVANAAVQEMGVLGYAVIAWVFFAVFVHWREEPMLARRFRHGVRDLQTRGAGMVAAAAPVGPDRAGNRPHHGRTRQVRLTGGGIAVHRREANGRFARAEISIMDGVVRS